MVLIPAPADVFVEKVKAKMRVEEIQNFGSDEINRVFDYVVQSEACIRVVNHLVNYENFTIDQLYTDDEEYEKYCVSHRTLFGGDVRTERFVYTKDGTTKLFDDTKKQIGEDLGICITLMPRKI